MNDDQKQVNITPLSKPKIKVHIFTGSLFLLHYSFKDWFLLEKENNELINDDATSTISCIGDLIRPLMECISRVLYYDGFFVSFVVVGEFGWLYLKEMLGFH